MVGLALAALSYLGALLPLLEDAADVEPFIAPLARLFASEGAAKMLGTLSLEQWLTVAAAVAQAAPSVQKAWAALHPAFDVVADALLGGKTRQQAAAAAGAWYSRNQPESIPGYGRDGGVVAVPNPNQ